MDYLKKLFSYDRWADTFYLQTLSAETQQDDRRLRLLSHIVAAQRE